MREIMEKALERFFPAGMREAAGKDSGCGSYYKPGSSGELEFLFVSQAELYHHPGGLFVLELGFYRLEPFSEDFQATYRVKFRLSDLEVA